AEQAPAMSPAATASPAAGTTNQQQQEGGAQSTTGTTAAGDPSRRTTCEAATDDSAATADPLALAYERGQAARAAGHARKAMPGEYRDGARKAEANAWTAGFDGKALDEGLL